MIGPVVLTLRCDASAICSALPALADVADGSAEACERILGLLDFPEELVAVELDSLPASAGEVVVRFYPSDRLLGLLSAGGAGNA